MHKRKLILAYITMKKKHTPTNMFRLQIQISISLLI